MVAQGNVFTLLLATDLLWKIPKDVECIAVLQMLTSENLWLKIVSTLFGAD